MPGKKCGDRNPGQGLVGQGRMACVRRNQHFVDSFTGDIIFAVRQMTILERSVDTNLVFAFAEMQESAVTQAKPPALLVIASPVGNPIRMIRQGEQMRP